MNREFNFTNLYYLNDNKNKNHSPLQYLSSENVDSVNRNSFVEISGDSEDSVICTLAKFVEIMDSQGLEGLAVL